MRHKHAGAVCCELFFEPFAAGDVEVVGRFVEKQQAGAGVQCAGQRGARSLPGGQAGKREVPFRRREPQPVEDLLRARLGCVAAGSRVLVHQLGVLAGRVALRGGNPGAEEREVRASAEDGVEEGIRLSGPLLAGGGDVEILAARDGAAGGLEFAGEDAEQRRLAAAVGAGNGEAVALTDGEGRVAEEFDGGWIPEGKSGNAQ